MSNLRSVRTRAKHDPGAVRIDRETAPTFLGIGSARCGSTWLYRALVEHPDVQMSTPKQLDFFDKNINRHDLRWYCSHFEPSAGEEARPVRGEISPRNAVLSTEIIRVVKRLFPSLRIVLLIRQPVDRIWSNAMHELIFRRGHDAQRISTCRLEQYCLSPRATAFSQYAQILRRWSDVFGKERILVERFEDIRTDPATLLKRVARHIGADDTWKPPNALLMKKVHSNAQFVGSSIPMPPSLRAHLSRRWIKPMQSLDVMLGGGVDDWVRELSRDAEQASAQSRARFVARSVAISVPEQYAYRLVRLHRRRRALRRWHLELRNVTDETSETSTVCKVKNRTQEATP